jgi:hypothetical protein
MTLNGLYGVISQKIVLFGTVSIYFFKGKGKGVSVLIKNHAMKVYSGAEAEFHAFVTSVLEESEWPRSSRFAPQERALGTP